jgi:hypothetical protein
MAQLQLIDGAAPARPSDRSEEVIAATAKRLVPEAVRWLKAGDGFYEEDTEASIEKELADTLRDEWDWDGFRLAKALEWEANSELVGILDAATGYQFSARRAAVAAWVREWNIRPKLAVGAKVTLPASLCGSEGRQRGGTFEGEIVGVNTELAEYTVRVAELGHLPPGAKQTGSYGFILPCEKVDPAAAPGEAANHATGR